MNITRLIRRLSYSLVRATSLKSIRLIKFNNISRFQYSTEMHQNMQEFILELKTPFEELDCREAFDNLSEKEQKYLHYYTKVRYCAIHSFLDGYDFFFVLQGKLVWFVDLLYSNISRIACYLFAVPSNLHN